MAIKATCRGKCLHAQRSLDVLQVYKATWNKVTTVAVKVMGGQIEDHTSGENAARAMEDFKREVLILKVHAQHNPSRPAQ